MVPRPRAATARGLADANTTVAYCPRCVRAHAEAGARDEHLLRFVEFVDRALIGLR